MQSTSTNAPVTPVRQKIIRRKYIIDRVFQLKYMIVLASLGAVISALFGAMMYLSHSESQQALVELFKRNRGGGFVDMSVIRAEMARFDTTFLWLVGGTTVLMAAALLLYGVLLTHRVAGPIYVMTLYVSALAKGHFPEMRKLRKSDELKEFFETLHSAVETLRSKEVEEVRSLGEAVEKLGSAVNSASGSEAVQILKELVARKNASLAGSGSPPSS